MFAYTSIIKMYLTSNRKKKGTAQSLVLNDKERKLIIKSLAITLNYVACFLLMLIKLIYEVSTSRAVPEEFDMATTFMYILNPPLNYALLFYFDANVKMCILELFGLEQWAGRKRSNNHQLAAVKIQPIIAPTAESKKLPTTLPATVPVKDNVNNDDAIKPA